MPDRLGVIDKIARSIARCLSCQFHVSTQQCGSPLTGSLLSTIVCKKQQGDRQQQKQSYQSLYHH